MELHFANPNGAHALWGVLALVLALFWLDGRGRADLERFLSATMLERLARSPSRPAHLGVVALGAGLCGTRPGLDAPAGRPDISPRATSRSADHGLSRRQQVDAGRRHRTEPARTSQGGADGSAAFPRWRPGRTDRLCRPRDGALSAHRRLWLLQAGPGWCGPSQRRTRRHSVGGAAAKGVSRLPRRGGRLASHPAGHRRGRPRLVPLESGGRSRPARHQDHCHRVR